MIVVGPYLELKPDFSNAKFVNYVFIKTWFVKLKVKTYVYLLYFQIRVVLIPSAPPSRGTIGDVSIGTWVEKGSPN